MASPISSESGLNPSSGAPQDRDLPEVPNFRYFARNPPSEVLEDGDVRVFVDAPGLSPAEFKRRRLAVTEPHQVSILDARTALAGGNGLAAWTLDTHGFQVFRPPPAMPNWRDTKAVMGDYYPRIIELVRRLTGATRGFPMAKSGGFLFRTEKPLSSLEAYSRFAHTDVGPDNVPSWRRMLVKRGVPEEEAETCDLCMFNVWHPVDRPAFRDPLCLLDAQTANLEEDVCRYKFRVSTDAKDANGEQMYSAKQASNDSGTSLGPLFNSAHRWVYISDQRPSEAWLFKQYDTRPNVAKCTFHNSFHDPFHVQESETPGRRSVEFRLVLSFPKRNERSSSSKPSSKL